MAARRIFVKNILLGASTVLTVGSLAACTSEKEPNNNDLANPSSTVAGTSVTVTPKMPQYLQAANDANVATPNTVVSIAARPTVTVQDSNVMAMTIRDEGQDEWKAGNYRLVVYCAGTGTLFAHFKIGNTSQIEEMPTCAPTITTSAVDLSLPSDVRGSSVIIIPAGNAQAGVSYQIQRM